MRTYLKKIGITALAALSLAVASVATADSANARPWGGFHHGFRHGFWGPRLGVGLALGALATPYWYDRPVALYGDCFVRRRIVGYTYWGRPIFRIRRVCY